MSQSRSGSGRYAFGVHPRQFVYPQTDVPLVDAYDGRFEATYILLHPFIAVPERLAWSVTRKYPEDAEIVMHGTPFNWSEVGQLTGIGSCARINQALLTATGSLCGELADVSARNALQLFLQSRPVWMPTEGRFEPLLQRGLLHVFRAAGCEEILHVPEFPDRNPVSSFATADLQEGSILFPSGGTLLAPDASFLFTVDWDSFFTLFYGEREFITQMGNELGLEGFFATKNTDHAWFNYSLGCATVTLSPEHWQGESMRACK